MDKKTLFLLFPLLSFLLLSPGEAVAASAAGVDLWFHTVLPSLLPFIILSHLLADSQALLPFLSKTEPFCRRLTGYSPAGCCVLLLGFFCGFPMGASLCASFLGSGRLSESEAGRLLRVSNQVSPLFLQGYLAALLPRSQDLRAVLGLYYGNALLHLFLSRFRNRGTVQAAAVCCAQKKETPSSLGERMDASIMNGFEIITRLGGYIILFSVYAALLKTLTAGIPLLSPVLSLLLEISSGSAVLLTSAIPLPLKLSLLTAGLSFGGISTIMQTASVIRGSGLALRTYVTAKSLQACTALLLSLFFFSVI